MTMLYVNWMSKHSRRILSVLMVILGGCSDAASPKEPSRDPVSGHSVFVYEVRSTGLTEILDLERRQMAIGGRELQRGIWEGQGDFGGPLDSCDTPQFYCLSTGLHIAVPRRGMPESWRVAHLACRARPVAAEEGVYRGVCSIVGRDVSLEFLYSPIRGVLSYRRVCSGCWPNEFTVVGRTGIFAQ
jgi:hypothetical protein